MNKTLQDIIVQVNTTKRLRVWSLILTFFGDAVVPRGGTISAQTVSSLMNEFGIEDGAVRTAFSRLANDKWVTRQKQGRSSFYSLAEKGYEPFAQATTKIYAIPKTSKPTAWILAVAQSGNKEELEKLTAQHHGFMLDTNMAVFNKPTKPLSKSLQSIDCLITDGADYRSPKWVSEHSKLQSLAKDFESFQSTFKHLPEDLTSIAAMTARCLLIHEWRRLILRMPDIPAQLLSNNWPAEACGKLVAQKYAALLTQSEEWMAQENTVSNDDNSVSLRFNVLLK